MQRLMRYNIRDTLRPKRYYLFITEKKRYQYKRIPIKPRAPLAKAILKKKVASIITTGRFEFSYFSELLFFLLKHFSNYSLVELFNVPLEVLRVQF